MRSDGSGEAVNASMKFCIAPEIAVEMAPARVRCSGSQSPSRHRTGNRKESAASVSQMRAVDW